MKKTCKKCGGLSDFDLDAIATSFRGATAEIAALLGVSERAMEHLTTTLTCQHCGATMELQDGD